MTIEAKDFGYTLPASMPSGWVDVTLHNSGKTGHQIAFTKLGTMSFTAFKAPAITTDGKTHAEHGMIGQVTVAQSPDSVEGAPRIDGGTITLSEFSFRTDASFTGTGTVAIKNVGTQVHEAIIVKEADGATLDKVKGFFLTPPGTPPPAGPPPFTSAGGIVGLARTRRWR